MSENDIKVAIVVEDKASGDIKKFQTNTETSLKKSKGAFSDLGNEIKGSFVKAIKGAIIAYAGFEVINKTIGTLKMARAEYQENALAQNKLRFALGYTSSALNEQAKILADKLKIDDTEISLAQAKLSAYVKNEQQIKQLIPAIMDLGTYLGSNEAAAQMLGRAFADDSQELGRLKISVTGAIGSQERLESIAKGVTTAFGGQAEAAAEVRDIFDYLGLKWKDSNESLWRLFVDLSRGTKQSAAEIDSFAAAQYKLDKATIATGKSIEGGIASPEMIQVALKRIENYEWQSNLTRGRIALGAAMERQRLENDILRKAREEAAAEKAKADEELARKISAFNVALIGPTREEFEAGSKLQQQKADNIIKINSTMIDDLEKSTDESFANWVKQEKEKAKIKEENKRQEIANNIQMAGDVFAAFAGANRRNAEEQKAIARVMAAINTAVAITKALPDPFAVAVAFAIGTAQQIAISNAKFARGGIGQGGYAMIGEEGPEMMYVPSGARVYNSNETRNMVNNTANNVTVNVLGSNGRVVETLRASIRSGSGDSFVRDLKNALAVA